MDTVDMLTASDRSIHTSVMHSHDRKLKCMMICAIMANNMET